MVDWQKMIVGAYYGCEISPLKDGVIQPSLTYWWNGSGWVEGRLPRHLWKDHKECRRRYRYAPADYRPPGGYGSGSANVGVGGTGGSGGWRGAPR